MEDNSITIRPARAGDGGALFEVTWLSVQALAKDYYSAEQIAAWMGKRTAAYYEDLISHGRVRVAERLDRIIGFVDAEPGELTRLFLLPSAAGTGLGHRLLVIGLEQARIGYKGPIRVEATLNAEGFYARHGFKTVCKGPASHQFSDDPIELAYMEMPQPEA